jgi:hypothetical protein
MRRALRSLYSLRFSATEVLQSPTMTSNELSHQLTRSLRRISKSTLCTRCLKASRNVTLDARSGPPQNPSDDLEQSSGFLSQPLSEEISTSFDPLRASRNRKKQLPPSRYETSLRMYCLRVSSSKRLTEAIQIPISTAKIRSRSAASSSVSTCIGSRFEDFHPRPFFLSPCRADLS